MVPVRNQGRLKGWVFATVLVVLLPTIIATTAQSNSEVTLLTRDIMAVRSNRQPALGAQVYLYSSLSKKTIQVGVMDKNGRFQLMVKEPLRPLMAAGRTIVDVPYSLSVVTEGGEFAVHVFSLSVLVDPVTGRVETQSSTLEASIVLMLNHPGVPSGPGTRVSLADVGTQDYLCDGSFAPDQFYNVSAKIGEISAAPGIRATFYFQTNSQVDKEAGVRNLTMGTGWTISGAVRVTTGQSTSSTFTFTHDAQALRDIYGPFTWVYRRYSVRGGGYCYNMAEMYAKGYNGGGELRNWLFYYDNVPSGNRGYVGEGNTKVERTVKNGRHFALAFSTPVGFSAGVTTQYANIQSTKWEPENPKYTWYYIYDQDWTERQWRALGTNTRHHD
jgi:hypothetical protein